MKEFTVVISPGGKTEISMRGYEEESQKLAKELEEVLGVPEKVDWRPRQHIGVGIKQRA